MDSNQSNPPKAGNVTKRKPMAHGVYVGSNLRLSRKGALLERGEDGKLRAQFDDLTLKEAYGWCTFDATDFVIEYSNRPDICGFDYLDAMTAIEGSILKLDALADEMINVRETSGKARAIWDELASLRAAVELLKEGK